jgi:glucose-1-phosphate adenylyltransferase
MRQFPPAKFVFAGEKENPPRAGKSLESLVSQGCIISGLVRSSVLSPNVVVRSYAQVDESVIMDDVTVGRHCRIRKAIIDKGNDIPEGTTIGYDPAEDRKLFTVSERGIVVVAKGHFKG